MTNDDERDGADHMDESPETNGAPSQSRLDDLVGGIVRKTLFKLRTPEQLARKLVTWAPDPASSADQAERWMASLVPSSPADIVGNYTRGHLLFAGDARFWWMKKPGRGIITPESAHVPKRVRTYARRDGVTTKFDTDIEAIIEGCQTGHEDSWLTPGLVELYMTLADMGFVTSVGTYVDGQLVAGNWGLQVGSTYGLQSMFHTEASAGAVALAAAVDRLVESDDWRLIDVGQVNPNFARYGAFECTVEEFCNMVLQGLVPSETT